MTPEHLVHARALIGTRWKHRGRSNAKTDCVGLVVLSLRRAGIAVEDRRLYGREPHKDGLREELRRQFGEPSRVAQVGDIGLFRGTVYPLHVAFFGDYYLGGLSLVHASNAPTENKVVEVAYSWEWPKRFIEAYRVTP